MPKEQSTYLQSCSMAPDELIKVYEMIGSRHEFSDIRIKDVNPNRETYGPLQAKHVRKGEVLVTFQIPSEGVDMASFYKEFYRALGNEDLRFSR